MSDKQAWVFVQWKGTDACFDFHCKCDKPGEPAGVGHFDGYNAYYLKCVRCGRTYQVPDELQLTEVSKTRYNIKPMEVFPDEDSN